MTESGLFKHPLDETDCSRVIDRLSADLRRDFIETKTLATMNEAVHGIEVEPALAAEALRVASEFLAELRRLAAE